MQAQPRTTYTTQAPVQGTVIRQPIRVSNAETRPAYLGNEQRVQVTSVRESGFRRNANERRLDNFSARELARMVFGKYDDNGSGYLNSNEAAQMITDLYASMNEHNPSNPQDGYDFMVANDANSDNSMNLKDFEDIFVKYLSTGDNTGFRLFFDQAELRDQNAPEYIYNPPTVHSNGLRETRVITTNEPLKYNERIPTRIVQ